MSGVSTGPRSYNALTSRACELYAEGLSYRRVAEVLGWSEETARRRIQRAGVPPRARGRKSRRARQTFTLAVTVTETADTPKVTVTVR
jgi:transposase